MKKYVKTSSGGQDKTKVWVVVTNYSFDSELLMKSFFTYEEARDYLKKNFEEEVRIDTEENEWEIEYDHDNDYRYAYLTVYFSDHHETTEWRIVEKFIRDDGLYD